MVQGQEWARGGKRGQGAGSREQAAILRVDEKEVQENGMAYSINPEGPSTKRERITRCGHEWHAAPHTHNGSNALPPRSFKS